MIDAFQGVSPAPETSLARVRVSLLLLERLEASRRLLGLVRQAA